MNFGCPNPECTFFHQTLRQKKDGHYYRRDDARFIQRFQCQHCLRKYSASTHSLECGQKKRRDNELVHELLASGVSMRRAARIARLHRTTIERKLKYLAEKARLTQQQLLLKFKQSPVTHLQFDDLITIEHTKLKPLSVSLAVDASSRFILGTNVSSIGAFGHLAKLSRKKYGKRVNNHAEKLDHLLKSITSLVHPEALVQSDEHYKYAPIVKKHFPHVLYQQFKGGRGAIVGQGELKKLAFDPLFMLNHTCAMLRANVNRLIRKTWCTTKKLECLQDHLDLYVAYHNTRLVSQQI